eukprot:636637-Amphidinium_carterae.1
MLQVPSFPSTHKVQVQHTTLVPSSGNHPPPEMRNLRPCLFGEAERIQMCGFEREKHKSNRNANVSIAELRTACRQKSGNLEGEIGMETYAPNAKRSGNEYLSSSILVVVQDKARADKLLLTRTFALDKSARSICCLNHQK